MVFIATTHEYEAGLIKY